MWMYAYVCARVCICVTCVHVHVCVKDCTHVHTRVYMVKCWRPRPTTPYQQQVFDDVRFLLTAVSLAPGNDQPFLEEEGPPLLERPGSLLHPKRVLQDEGTHVQLVLTLQHAQVDGRVGTGRDTSRHVKGQLSKQVCGACVVCVHVCTCIMHVCACIYLHMYSVHVCVQTCVHVCVHTCVHVCVL